jgi:hypothetical protein
MPYEFNPDYDSFSTRPDPGASRDEWMDYAYHLEEMVRHLMKRVTHFKKLFGLWLWFMAAGGVGTWWFYGQPVTDFNKLMFAGSVGILMLGVVALKWLLIAFFGVKVVKFLFK